MLQSITVDVTDIPSAVIPASSLTIDDDTSLLFFLLTVDSTEVQLIKKTVEFRSNNFNAFFIHR